MKRVYSSQLDKFVNKSIIMYGWIFKRRDHGKLIFIDLMDDKGITQLVVLPSHKEAHKIADSIRAGFIVSITGKVNKRPEKMINNNIASGKYEIEVINIDILSTSETPPIELDKDTSNIDEEIRLKYRYLDLRTKRMQFNIRARHSIIHFIRNYFNDHGFIEIQTPILSKSTPEGARDYLVPSRLHPGKFFALPQSPQQYKQLLMIAGFSKYFQIAPCFRDEDSRADRSPGEFYQLDIEMSYVKQDDILELVEDLFTKLIKSNFKNKKLTFTKWPKLKYNDVIKKYKSDKPDLRKDKNDPNELAFAWIVDFPLFTEQSESDYFHGAGAKLGPSHHMFTSPKETDISKITKNPLKIKSYQHDLVLNGLELGGGSIRINNWKIQETIFDIIGFNKQQKDDFSHMKKAFSYGVPPHGGIAVGIERLCEILCGENNIKEVIAFPLSGEARDPLMDSPTKVTKKQLKEVHVKTDYKKKRNIVKKYKKI